MISSRPGEFRKLAYFDRSSGRLFARDTTTWKKAGKLLLAEKELEGPQGGITVTSPDGKWVAWSERLGIGREERWRITLDDANVSRRHAEVRRQNGNWFIVDLGSTNGIEVNGKRTDRAKLEHDDRILLGRTEVTFERS